MRTVVQEREAGTISVDELLGGIVRTPGNLELITRKLEAVSQHLLYQQEAGNERTAGIEANARMLQDLLDRQSLLEEASRQQRVLSQEHYEQHVIEPLTRHLFSIMDLSDASKVCCSQPAELLNRLQGVHSQTLELLSIYGCEPLRSALAEDFDPATMRPIERRETNGLERDGKVAESLQMGFRRGERILRFEAVALYRARVNDNKEGDV